MCTQTELRVEASQPRRDIVVNGLLGRPYLLGASGPDAFDCYGCARLLQRELFNRAMPEFSIPGEAGRSAIAAAIAAHPERGRWVEITAPQDGALVTMARNTVGYHLGTWLEDDGGIIVHAIEDCGVVVDTMPSLEAIGWRKFRFHLPA